MMIALILSFLLAAEGVATQTDNTPSCWIGHKKDELIAVWGEPDNVETINGQNTSLIYTRSQIVSRSIDISYNGRTWGNSEGTTPNSLIIIVNEFGIIVNFDWSQSEQSNNINWYAIGHTVVIVGLIALFVYVMHFMPNPDGDWVG